MATGRYFGHIYIQQVLKNSTEKNMKTTPLEKIPETGGGGPLLLPPLC